MRVAVLLGVLISILVWAFIPQRNRPRITLNEDVCRSNLRALAINVMVYANEHGGVYPAKDHQLFEYALSDSQSNASYFVCPSTGLDWTIASTTQQAIAEFDQGQLMSYEYTGGGLTSRSPADAVLFYEPITNHGDQVNVVFNNGRVVKLSVEVGARLITELQSGHNPPRPEMLTPNSATTPAVAP